MASTAVKRVILRKLIAVAMIVGIESAVAGPRINDAIKDYRLTTAATTVWEDMQRAKAMAIREKRTIRVDFDHDSYSIIRVSTGEVALSRNLSREYPQIRIVVTESSRGIVFDSTGAAGDDSKDIEIKGPAGTRHFTILATGKIGRLS